MFSAVVARRHARIPLEGTGKVHHTVKFTVIYDLLDPHIGHDQQFSGADHLLVPDKSRRRKTVYLPEETAEMIQGDPVFSGQPMEIEIPERVFADIIADLKERENLESEKENANEI